MDLRKYDLVVVGAGGLTGRLVAECVARNEKVLRDDYGRRRWAVSGRDKVKLMKALAHLPGGVPDIIEADLAQADSLTELTKATQVIVNLAGPFTPTAPNLIHACVETGTSYVDLSGEIPLLQQVIEQFDEPARNAGIKIIQMSGWEALPADLVTLLASRRAVALDEGVANAAEGPGSGGPVSEVLVTAVFKRKPDGNLPLSQAVSAGTLSSIVEMLESNDAELIGAPGSLLPHGSSHLSPAPLRLRPFEADGRLITPFSPVAFLNAPIIHRTAALRAGELGGAYVPARYLEGEDAGDALDTGTGKAWARTVIQRAIIGIAHTPQGFRRVIAAGLRAAMPEPGSGPTGRFLTDWKWTVQAKVKTADGRSGEAQLDGIGHPGYTATAAMIAEVGMRIAVGRATERVGCITPALALGSLDLDPWFVDGLELR